MLAHLLGAMLVLCAPLAAQPVDEAQPPKAEPTAKPAEKPVEAPAKPETKEEKPDAKPDETPVEEKGGLLLRYKFAAGQKMSFRSRSELQQRNATGATAGEFRETAIIREQTDRLQVLELDEKGRAQVEWKMDGLKIEARFPQGNYQFSSDHPPETTTPLGKILTPLYTRTQGIAVRLAVGPQGELSDLRGYADRVREVATGHPLAVQCGYGGTNNGLRVALEEMTVIFGDKVVRPGEKWEMPIHLEAPALGRVRGKRVYTLIGPETASAATTPDAKPVAPANPALLRIQFTTELQYDIAVEQGNVTITGKLATTESSGVALFDPVAGRLESLKSRYKLNGKLTVVVDGMSKEVASEQTQSVTVETLKTP